MRIIFKSRAVFALVLLPNRLRLNCRPWSRSVQVSFVHLSTHSFIHFHLLFLLAAPRFHSFIHYFILSFIPTNHCFFSWRRRGFPAATWRRRTRFSVEISQGVKFQIVNEEWKWWDSKTSPRSRLKEINQDTIHWLRNYDDYENPWLPYERKKWR